MKNDPLVSFVKPLITAIRAIERSMGSRGGH